MTGLRQVFFRQEGGGGLQKYPYAALIIIMKVGLRLD